MSIPWWLKPRLSLRSLLVLTLIVCFVLAVWSVQVRPYRDQHAANAMIKRLGGEIQLVDAEGSSWQRWLVKTMVDEDAFVRTIGANLEGADFKNEDAAKLRGLIHLELLRLDRSSINDAGLSALEPLEKLRVLSLRYCSVSDKGLSVVGQKPELSELWLTGTDVSDDSVDRLSSFVDLKSLYLRWTRTTADAAREIQQRLPDCEVYHRER